MSIRGYKSLWHIFNQDEAAADELMDRTHKIVEIIDYVRLRRLSVARASKFFNVTPEQLNKIKAGIIEQIDPALVAAMHDRLPKRSLSDHHHYTKQASRTKTSKNTTLSLGVDASQIL